MAGCSVSVLGRFEVAVDGQAVPVNAWRSRRAADVVKILALAPGSAMHREQVMAALWPELGSDAAAANLRKAVHYARRAIGDEEVIRSESGVLTLRADVDATRFLAAADTADTAGDPEQCQHAAALYTGELLPADRYEEWLEEPRRRMRERYLALLRGARQWDRVLAHDPTDELAHRELMRAHLLAGRRRDAIRQFERLRAALREHIGVGPDRETIALYEQVLAAEGAPPPEPSQRAAVLIATGLVHLNRLEFDDAERLARQARELALDAGLAHEVGDASTLLALVSSFTGRWHEVFRELFVASFTARDEVVVATYDANLCFAEYYLIGAGTGPDPHAFAKELLTLAEASGSVAGRGAAQLMLGEVCLASGRYGEAFDWLRQAVTTNRAAQATSGWCISLERLAQAELAHERPDEAHALLDQAFPVAESSLLRSHLLVRLLGVAVQATTDARSAVLRAERTLMDSTRVCEPCSMDFHINATLACAGARDLARARRHLADAERIAGLWPGAPLTAAVWEARAGVRRAEGQPGQADALLAEAADEYARAGRPVDAQRCRQTFE
jgi:DNA-binding SARP family transcriptional activator